MNNQEYLQNMSPEQKQRSRIEGTVGIIRLAASLVEEGGIIVNPDTLHDENGTFSFEYKKVG